MLKNIPRNVKVVISGIGPLLALIILSIFAFKIGLGKISEVRAKVTKARSDLNILQTKLNLLQSAQSTVAANSGLATGALPSENPALSVVVQMKALSSQNGLIIENIKTGTETKDATGLSRVDVTFDINGARPQVFLFLSSIPKIAPISMVEKVKLTETGGVTRATVVVKSFWADLPSKIPAVTQEIKDLTPEEAKILTEISALIQPSFIQVTPGQGAGKTDPFSF